MHRIGLCLFKVHNVHFEVKMFIALWYTVPIYHMDTRNVYKLFNIIRKHIGVYIAKSNLIE